MAATQIDPQAKANIDRIERRKMNSLKRVQSLPARGSLGDWVVVAEKHMQSGEEVSVDVAYAWMENKWIMISGGATEGEIRYSTRL